MTEDEKKVVRCQICGAPIPEGESMQENDQILCEDCYINLKENNNECKTCIMKKSKNKEKKY